MTTIAMTRRTLAGTQGIGRFGRLIAAVAHWQKIRADRRLLQTMPDYMLADIGISRGEIEHATKHGRARS